MARDNLKLWEQHWHSQVGRYHLDHTDLSRSVQRITCECRGLASQYQAEYERLTANAESLARIRHLRLYLIADHTIRNIGAQRTQVLASCNVTTAADIDERTIRAIDGFGDVLTGVLLKWKEEVLQQFRFNPETAVSLADQRAATLKFRTRQQRMLTDLDCEVGKLESLAPACQAALQQMIPELQHAAAVFAQAEVDFHFLSKRK